MMRILTTLCICFLASLGGVEPALDVVELKNGRKIEGRVVFEDDEMLVVRVKSREREFDQEKVAKVSAVSRELPKALDEIAALEPGTLEQHHALAKSLLARNLPHEAELVYWKVIEFARNDVIANEALGHRKRGKTWTIPHEGRWYKFDKRIDLLKDWGDSWNFATTHFEVRTAQQLEGAIPTTLLLEETYRALYETFGSGLKLRATTKPIRASIYTSAKSFPESLAGPRSYYSAAERRLLVNASRGLNPGTIVHEATHAIFHATSQETGSGGGDFPGWLDEGLAVYMAKSLITGASQIDFEPGKPDPGWFQVHATAKKPYRLSRMLNMQTGDFVGGSKVGLKYAQSYSLVHFLLHGEKGVHREGFFNFIAGVYEGKASSTHFKKCFDVKAKDLEKAWHEHAANGGRSQ